MNVVKLIPSPITNPNFNFWTQSAIATKIFGVQSYLVDSLQTINGFQLGAIPTNNNVPLFTEFYANYGLFVQKMLTFANNANGLYNYFVDPQLTRDISSMLGLVGQISQTN